MSTTREERRRMFACAILAGNLEVVTGAHPDDDTPPEEIEGQWLMDVDEQNAARMAGIAGRVWAMADALIAAEYSKPQPKEQPSPDRPLPIDKGIVFNLTDIEDKPK